VHVRALFIRDWSMVRVHLKDQFSISFHQPVDDSSEMSAICTATVAFKSLKSVPTKKTDFASPKEFIPSLEPIMHKEELWPRYFCARVA
jgi:hypothetical protein